MAGRAAPPAPRTTSASIVMRESVARFMRLRRGALARQLYRATTGILAVVRLSFIAVLMLVTLGQVRRPSSRAAMRKWTRMLNWTLGR